MHISIKIYTCMHATGCCGGTYDDDEFNMAPLRERDGCRGGRFGPA